MIETTYQPFFNDQSEKQGLKDDQPCKRRQPLILKFDLRNLMDSTINLFFATLHFEWPPALDILLFRNQHFIQSGGHSSRVLSLILLNFYASDGFILSFQGFKSLPNRPVC